METGEHYISWQALVFGLTGLTVYSAYFLRKVLEKKIDVHDYLLLSAVAVIPGLFLLFPSLAHWASRLLDVKFPFVLIFSALFLIQFLIIYVLMRRIHILNRKLTTLVQDVALHEGPTEPAR